MRVPVEAARFSGFGESDFHPIEAFDNALRDSHVHEYNLVYYSSILPANIGFVGIEAYLRYLHSLPRGTELPVVLSIAKGSYGEYIIAAIGYAYHPEVGGVVVETHARGKNPDELDMEGITVDAVEFIRRTEKLAKRLFNARFDYKPVVHGVIRSPFRKIEKRYGVAVAGVAFLKFKQL